MDAKRMNAMGHRHRGGYVWRRLPITTLMLLTILVVTLGHQGVADAYIRVVREAGVWWFQDDAGRKFFSLGVNCLAGCYGHTEATPLAPSRRTRIVGLVNNWQFNTAGSWSSPSVWNALYFTDRIYMSFRSDWDDVFDEAFWSGAYVEQLKAELQPFLGQTNFLGYFLDNEPSWPADAIFRRYLSLSATRPGSKAFISYLKSWYHSEISRLNTEWGTSYPAFSSIPGSPVPPRRPQNLLNAWRTHVATVYYRRYASLVRTYDPHHLILGIRYRNGFDVTMFKRLSPFFDVNSINGYHRDGTLRPLYGELAQATGKPILITEFSFTGYPVRVSTPGLGVEVFTQANRALRYDSYVRAAARAPFIVGMHWFMWRDYPKSDIDAPGYPYPADENVGLVSYDERCIYDELVEQVKRTNAEVPGIRNAVAVP